jgi:expansin (peptidoglycan-binding protein)
VIEDFMSVSTILIGVGTKRVAQTLVMILSFAILQCGGDSSTREHSSPPDASPVATSSDDLTDTLDIFDSRGVNCSSPSRTGFATYYTWANGGGNCLFDPTPNDLMVGAMNQIDYAGSGICGATALVRGPRGTITIRVVDQCPECPQGDIDLSPLAFSQIADLSQGRVPIKWKLIPAAVQGNIIYHFKDGSNQWWTAVQVRNHRYPITRFEYMSSPGVWKTVRRQTYNYFVEPLGMGPGPYMFRVTDMYGQTLVDTGIPHTENGNVAGAGQFPLCTPQVNW